MYNYIEIKVIILKKNGWGLSVEIIFILIFAVCIIIAVIILNTAGLVGKKDNSYTTNNDFDYNALEEKAADAGKEYYNENYKNGTDDTIIVSIQTLNYGGYLKDKIYDENNKECTGYVKLLKTGNQIAYISCSKYETPGYESDYE